MDNDLNRLLILGDVGVDLVMGPISGWPRIGTESIMERSDLRAGGSAANAALTVSHLGGKSQLASGVGNDQWGTWLREQLRDLGASLPICDAPTTLSVGLIDSSGERTFFTTRGHLEKLSYDHVRPRIDPAPTPGSIALLSGVFLTPVLRRSYLRLIRDLRMLGYQVALDTNWPPHDWSAALRDEVAAWISGCDHVLLNELEVSSLADSPNLEIAIDRLTAMLKPQATLVVKAGARGAIGIQAGRRSESVALEATVFDTIGAGDSFNAGYLLARLSGAELADSLSAGCSAAAAIISRFPRRASGAPAEPIPALRPKEGVSG
jgi:ribokinase